MGPIDDADRCRGGRPGRESRPSHGRSAVGGRAGAAGVCAGRLLTAALLALGLAGCATTTELDRFGDFAAAGTQYTQAADTLLGKAGDVLVDTNSEKLLRSVALAAGTAAQLAEQDAAVRANLVELALLRRQLQTLGDYFGALANLATSPAAGAVAAELQNTVPALDGLSQQLRGRPLAASEAALQQLAGGLGELVVRGVQVGALKRELEARRQTIAEVLRLQQALLAAVRAQVAADLSFSANRQYEDQVVTAYVTPDALASPEQQQSWTDSRRTLLGQPAVVPELDAAIGAAQALRQAWIKLLADELTAADLTAVVGALQPILAALDRL